MKITYLSASVLPSQAANSVHVMRMCNALAGHGHEVTLYGMYGGGSTESVFRQYGIPETFELVRTPFGGVPVARAFLRLLAMRVQFARRPAPDLVYGRDVLSLYAIAGRRWPVAFEAHHPPTSALHMRVLKKLMARPNFRRLVVISDALRRDFEEIVPGFPAARICVAHDGADPISDELRDVEFQGREHAVHVGYIGSLLPGRGVELLLNAAQQLPRLDFHVIGGTPEQVQERRREYPQENIHFYGFRPNADVPSYLSKMQIITSPYQNKVSIGTGFDTQRWMSPMKVFEAMSAGCAILSSDLPVLREVLEHERNALMVAPDRLEEWVDALGQLADDAELRDRLGSAARKDLNERYSWARRANYVLEGV